MRLTALLAALALVMPATGSAAVDTSLTITLWRHEGSAPPRERATLTCGPAGGTLARPAAACARLAAAGGAKAFRPIPQDAVCAELYGGPTHAVISGRIGGRTIWVRLGRRNGCEIDRWRRLAFLLPG